jgi:hypothetical protein
MEACGRHLRRLGPETMRIGLERAFIPADAEELLPAKCRANPRGTFRWSAWVR